MDWDWDFVRQILPTLIQGVKITILATLLGSLVILPVWFLAYLFRPPRRSSDRAD